ncbi:phage tail protein [Morganella morganii]|uniref:phage tail protein n=1 Tax=Morganella morganii TaxID=582 RepID=UPI0031194AE9
MQNLMPPIDTTDHAFHDGDPTTGQLGTIVTAAWLNDVQGATRDIQAEIIAVLTKAAIQPNPQKQNQLAEAISQIIGSGGYATSGDLTLGLSKKIDKADIAQQLGNDTTKVPSLHLVATELGKKASIADANSKLAKDQNGADIPDKPKFIENLGLGEAAKSGVVQGTGSSTKDVMSQKSVTDALNEKQPAGNYYRFSEINEMPGRGFNGVFSGGIGVKYIKGISVSSGGQADTGQIFVDFNAVVTARYLNSNGSIRENRIVGIPIGATIEWQSTATIPENFLANDGRSFSASDYPELAKIFPGLKLPDDRGLFKRGLDSGKNIDPRRVLGSVQSDAMQNLTGRFGNPTIEGGDFSEGGIQALSQHWRTRSRSKRKLYCILL